MKSYFSIGIGDGTNNRETGVFVKKVVTDYQDWTAALLLMTGLGIE
jgi:hypothetical protein